MPPLVLSLDLEALGDDKITLNWRPNCCHPRVGNLPKGKEILGQSLIFGSGWAMLGMSPILTIGFTALQQGQLIYIF